MELVGRRAALECGGKSRQITEVGGVVVQEAHLPESPLHPLMDRQTL